MIDKDSDSRSIYRVIEALADQKLARVVSRNVASWDLERYVEPQGADVAPKNIEEILRRIKRKNAKKNYVQTKKRIDEVTANFQRIVEDSRCE